jgi:xanthine dehydrogenase accessory factor
MVINASGDITGSVSGGCVEADVIERAMEVLANGAAQLVHYGISDQTAWDVGLMCGGQIDVFIEKLDEQFDGIAQLYRQEKTFTLTKVILGSSIGQTRITLGASAVLDDEYTFTEVIYPPAALYIVGASHIAITLVDIAKTIGYRVTVIDPRTIFATQARFEHADKLVIDYPQHFLTPAMLHARSALAVVAHDPKIDDGAIILACQSETGYIGALGSRRTHAERLVRLRKAGLSDEQLARIHAPIGLDIGAGSPEEIALAIAAQMVAVRCSTYN